MQYSNDPWFVRLEPMSFISIDGALFPVHGNVRYLIFPLGHGFCLFKQQRGVNRQFACKHIQSNAASKAVFPGIMVHCYHIALEMLRQFILSAYQSKNVGTSPWRSTEPAQNAQSLVSHCELRYLAHKADAQLLITISTQEKICFNFSFSTLPADGLALVCARPSTGTVVPNSGSHT